MEAAQLATCAQVEYWITDGESTSVSAGIKRMKIGEFEVEYNGSQGADSLNTRQIAPRAKNYLADNGLMYKGVRLNYADTSDFTN